MTLNHVVDALDRRYSLVENATSGDALLHEVRRFVDWIRVDTSTSPHVRDILREEEALRGKEQRALSALADRCRVLLCAVEEHRPDRDTTSYEFEQGVSAEYQLSMTRARRLLDRVVQHPDELAELLPDVVRNLHGRTHLMRQDVDEDYTDDDLPESLRDEAAAIKESHRYLSGERDHRERVSPAVALEAVFELADAVNPAPLTGDQESDFVAIAKRMRAEEDLKKYDGDEPINDQLRGYLHRIHTELRIRIGTTLSHQALVARFKARCAWYDRDRLRALVTRTTGKAKKVQLIREKENALVEELARYLFDNGIWALLRTRISAHEFDLVSPFARPLLVEGKAYTKAARKEIVKGIGQLHAYMVKIEGTPLHVSEAYYVIFRLGGPLYDLPRTITTNRFSIWTHTIDLGLAAESGRKQPKPIVIPEPELVGAMEKEQGAS